MRAVQAGQGDGHQPDQPHGGAEGSPERVPTFTLGVADATPLEMAEAYATFAGRGLHCYARPVTEILDASKNVVKAYPKQCQQVLPSAVADAVNDVLRGVMEPGGFGNGAGINTAQVSAGKTGTTNSQQSVWFVGYTPNLAAASMIAGANQEGSPDTIVGKSIGGQLPLRGVRFRHRRSDVGRRDEGHPAVAARRRTSPRPAADEITGLLVTIPDVRHDHRPGHQRPRGRRLHRGGGRRDRLRATTGGSSPAATPCSGNSTPAATRSRSTPPTARRTSRRPKKKQERQRRWQVAAAAADAADRGPAPGRPPGQTSKGGAAPPACSRTPPRGQQREEARDRVGGTPAGLQAHAHDDVHAAHRHERAHHRRLQADEQPEAPGHRDQHHRDPEAGHRQVALDARRPGPGGERAARSRRSPCSRRAGAPPQHHRHHRRSDRLPCASHVPPPSIVPRGGLAETVPEPQYRPREALRRRAGGAPRRRPCRRRPCP